MRRSLFILTMLIITVIQSGCIIAKTPSTRDVTMALGDQKTFSVSVFPSNATYIWTLDDEALSNTTSSYVYKADVGDHTLSVTETSRFGTFTYIWEIHVKGYNATGTWVFKAEFQPSYEGQEEPFILPYDGIQMDIEQSGHTFVAAVFGSTVDGTVSGTEYSFVYEYSSNPVISVTVHFTLTSETTATGTMQTLDYTYALTGTKKLL